MVLTPGMSMLYSLECADPAPLLSEIAASHKAQLL